MVAGVGAAAATGVGHADRGLLQDDKQGGAIVLETIGGHSTGIFGEGAAEIPAYDPETERVFVVNANAGAVTVLDGSEPTDPTKVAMLETSEQFASAGDLGPEGLVFVSGADSPIDDALLIVGFETSGTTGTASPRTLTATASSRSATSRPCSSRWSTDDPSTGSGLRRCRQPPRTCRLHLADTGEREPSQ